MVEGPGCKLKGEKIKSKLINQTVQNVQGSAVKKGTKSKTSGGMSPFYQLVSRRLQEVQTLGKELFMYFGDICLRVHFLMSGSFRINNQTLDRDASSKSEAPMLELHMSPDKLSFYLASVDVRPSGPCRQRYEELNDLDICSARFNHNRAVTLVMSEAERQLCDVLLDQKILPGVGNIIKNEALFDSGIRPSSKVKEVTVEHVSHLVKMTRDFSMTFYKCRKDGTPLKRFMKIYKMSKCGQCDGRVVICRMGDDNDRVTYFCENCQNNDLKSSKLRKLPTKNSLLGWVQSNSSTTAQEDWSCPQCTLINKPAASHCVVCLAPRIPQQESNKETTKQVTVKGLPLLARSSNQSTIPPSNAVKKRKLSSENIPDLKRRKTQTNTYTSSQLTSPALGASNSHKSGSDVRDTCKTGSDITSKIPFCPGHNKKCAMLEVRKQGNNYLRWFFTCSASKAKQCKFFKWADESFPICSGHRKPCTIKTVMKLGPNNGRKFFVCSMQKNKQCNFFEWAVGYD